jgi:CHAT domain-containing protein
MHFVPDLVFLNCCHLGNTDESRQETPPYPELAANIATQFMNMGVRAVVAAGWAVDDKAARAFAESFYKAMLEGTPFGEAVLRAREDLRAEVRRNTWGAYQCYGGPVFCQRTVTGRMVAPQIFWAR